MEQEIRAVLILEILGRPPENVTMALELLTEQIGKEKDVDIVNKKIFEPKPVPNSNNLFSSFAEIEIKTLTLQKLVDLCFRYMPSSVEITEPQELKINLNDVNVTLNSLVARLHNYDAIAKKLVVDNNILQKQLKDLTRKQFQQAQSMQLQKQEKKSRKRNKKVKEKSKIVKNI